MLIDAHSHIFSEEFRDDREEVLNRAIENDIRKIVLPNIDSSTVKMMLDLADQYPQICFPLMGLHPTSVKEDYEEELELVEYWIKKRKFYGIGEVGIDLHWDRSFLNEQRDVFRRQVILAKKYDLPLVIHTRDAFNETYKILEEEKSPELRGVFHSFDGTLEEAQKVIKLGFAIGVNGRITYKNNSMLSVIPKIDPKNILLETDAPYLAPVPFRGKRNESSYIIYIAQKLACLYNLSVCEIAEVTTENAENLFKI